MGYEKPCRVSAAWRQKMPHLIYDGHHLLFVVQVVVRSDSAQCSTNHILADIRAFVNNKFIIIAYATCKLMLICC